MVITSASSAAMESMMSLNSQIAHMGVDLRVVFRHRSIDTESFHPPCQIRIPVATLQRQAFPQGRSSIWMIPIPAASRLRHFIAQREGYLFRNRFTATLLSRGKDKQRMVTRAVSTCLLPVCRSGLSVFAHSTVIASGGDDLRRPPAV